MQFTAALISVVALLPFVTAQGPRVDFFTQTNFQGKQLTITPDGSSCVPFGPPFDQHVESVKVQNARCFLYSETPDCTGDLFVVLSDTSDLDGFKDRARSYFCEPA